MAVKVLKKYKQFTVSPSTKGQVVIPKELRDHFKIDENSKLLFSFDDKSISFVKIEDDIDSVYGSLGKLIKNKPARPLTEEQLEKNLKEAKELHFKAQKI